MPILVTALLVLLVVLVAAEIAVVHRLRDEGSTEETSSSEETADGDDEPTEEVEPLDLSMVARVVTRGDGEEVGESLCVEDGEVIVKGDDGFYAVPQAKVAESGEQLVAEGVDWEQARDEGGDWADRNNDPLAFGDDGMPSNP